MVSSSKASALKLVSTGLPEPTEKNPFAQIDYLFRRRADVADSPRTGDSYIGVSKVFKNFLADIAGDDNNPDRFLISAAFPWDIHFRYYKWLAARKDPFAPATITRHLNHLRQVINYGRAHKYIKGEVLFVTFKKGNAPPTNDGRTAYETNLFEPIRDLLENQYHEIKRGHVATKVDPAPIDLPGRDPRLKPPHRQCKHMVVLDFLRENPDEWFTPNIIESILGLGGGPGKRAAKLWHDLGVIVEEPNLHFSSGYQSGWKYKFKREPTEAELLDNDPGSYGWNNLDNVIWYIVNVLEGEIPRKNTENLPDKSIGWAVRKQGGLEKMQAIMVARGIPCTIAKERVTAPEIITLAAMLAMATGLNVESLSDLSINCIASELISGKPCLKYVKLRSKGKKSLTLFDEEDQDLYSDFLGITGGTEKLLFFSLLPSADRVQEIIETALRLTEDIRKKAPPEHAKRLFIFEDMQLNVAGINPNNIQHSWAIPFRQILTDFLKGRAKKQCLSPEDRISKEKEIEEQVANASINLSKFRSSLATELSLAGAPIEVIQAVLGHRNRSTTRLYLDRHRMEISYHSEITEALNKIKNNVGRHIAHCKDDDDLARRVSNHPTPENTSGYIFETGTPLFCRNPYQPSDHIKSNIKDWVEGKSTCHRWNKCLFCENVVIVDLALPKLIVYHNKLKLDLEGCNDSTPGKEELLVKTVAVIDKIIDPKSGFFGERTIADARARAKVFSGAEADHYFYKGLGA